MSVISNHLFFRSLFVIPQESKNTENNAVYIPAERHSE